MMSALWMLLASFLFSLMGVCVKWASLALPTAQIVAWRGLIGMVMMLGVASFSRTPLKTRMPGAHIWRGAVGVTALWLWFLAIGHLPLAMAVTLNYMSPIWIAVILFMRAWQQHARRFEWGLAAILLGGFAGVVLLLRPSVQVDELGYGLIALGSGMLAALAYLQVREMGMRGEPEVRVVFYFSMSCAVAGALGSPLAPLPDSGAAMSRPLLCALVLAIGLTAGSAQVAMTRAYRLGHPMVVANLQYVGIVFSSLWGGLIWHESLSWQSWLGVAVILCSALLASFYNQRQTGPALAPGDPLTME